MNLIIFFNGWGMDSKLFKIFSKDSLDEIEKTFDLLFVNYPYTISKENCQIFSTSVSNLDFFKERDSDIFLESIQTKYEKIFILGWSFGVYYANFFLGNNPKFQKYDSIAINGTPEIVGKYGISEKMIRFTMENLSSISLEKFYRNMGSEIASDFSLEHVPPLQEELQYLLKNYERVENFFKYVLISQKDRIVPPKNIERYFLSRLKSSKIKKIPENHFLFSSELSITDIIRMFV